MKYFGSNIKIDGTALTTLFLGVYGPEQEHVAKKVAAKYEERVTKLLGLIHAKSAGKVLLSAIGRLSKSTMTIEPKVKVADPDCSSPDEINAYAEPGFWSQDAFKRGKKTDLSSIKGTGHGCDTTIAFTPNEWLNSDIKGKLGLNANSEWSADEVLVHEMVHGLRMMAGVRNDKKVPFQWRRIKYDKKAWNDIPEKCREGKLVKEDKDTVYVKEDCYPNIEEWFAVLIQNIYRSQCSRLLRIEYTRSVGNFTEKQFIRSGMNRFHMWQFRREHRDFFSDLREINVPFNPTRLVLDI